MPWVWLGVTAENQRHADERIPVLLDTPAAVRFVSIEPMLGPVNLIRYGLPPDDPGPSRLDWIIHGGETGPGARPMQPEWALDVYRQCKAAGVPFFFKQWGSASKPKPWADWLCYAAMANTREFPEVARRD